MSRTCSRRRSIAVRPALFALLAAFVLLAWPRGAAAEPPAGEAGWLYDPDAVAQIEMTLPEDSIEALEAEPDEYVPGTFALAGTGGEYGPLDVGIRLKGGLGSFRPLTQKAAFKVKFDEYVDDQKLLGLEKLTLNNMVQDPSMLHETLAYEAFRSLGVPASRTGYAFVSVNGEDFGLYLDVETLDRIALARWFGSTRHLYEGGYENDVTPGGAGDFEVDEGKKSNRDDLEALIAAANSDAGDWSDGVAPFADLDEMTRAWAAERYLGHWDGYAGMLLGFQPNNYYLHSETSGLFTTLPWGTDQTWEVRIPFGAPAGVLFNRCLGDPSCAAMYRDAVIGTRDAIAALDVPRRIEEISETIEPWQLADPRREASVLETEQALDRTRYFALSRADDVDRWLEGDPAAPIAPLPEPERQDPEAEAQPPAAQASTAPAQKPKTAHKNRKRRRKCRHRQGRDGSRPRGSVEWRRWLTTAPKSSSSSTATRSRTGRSSRCPSR